MYKYKTIVNKMDINDNEILVKLSFVYCGSSLQKEIQYINNQEDPYIFFRFNSDSVEINNVPFNSENNNSEMCKLYISDFDYFKYNSENSHIIKFNVKSFIFLLGEIEEGIYLTLYISNTKKNKLVMYHENLSIGRINNSVLRLEKNIKL